MSSYLDTVNEKKQAQAIRSKGQQELNLLLQQIKQVEIAVKQSKTEPTESDDNDLKGMINKLTEFIKSNDQSKLNTEQIATLRELKSSFDSLKTTISNKKTDNSELVAAIQGIKFDIPAPNVTVKERAHEPIDFTPLQDTIKEYFKAPEVEEEKIDLDCYRAQDITDNGDIQYVGFVNPEGNWYIIENKVRENQLRYIFGDKGYAKAFKKAAQYEYMLLNEAINAVRS